MTYPLGENRVTGVLVPLASLRSDESIGCGEFPDIKALGAWCASAGIGIIQLLPVNDTGSQSSPYSALSAFALHPIYLRIEDLPEFGSLTRSDRAEIEDAMGKARLRHRDAVRFDYAALLSDKMALLRTVYDRSDAAGAPHIDSFVRDHPWVESYARFRAIKDENEQKPWVAWPGLQGAGDQGTAYSSAARFYSWLQAKCADQFRAAVMSLESAGVALKGDLPILMNEDSADVWAERDVFVPDLRAGAPPDMFSELGQNWGFPIYSWSALERRDYDWWKARLRESASYYHAYRIDHVLGFFRIWAIPAGNVSGVLGFFWPQEGIVDDELAELGFDDGRIRWLAEPHIHGQQIRDLFGDAWSSMLGTVFVQVGSEDLYVFAPAIRGEVQIHELETSDEKRQTVLGWYRDRALVRLPDGRLAESWNFRSCSRFLSLSDEERSRFEALVAEKHARNNELWEREGKVILRELTGSTETLACAEDLGVVPPAVPKTLSELSILGLRIPRWSRRWDEPGQPMISIDAYPELSVTAPSVHDTSTLRGWWEHEEGREELWQLAGGDGPCPDSYDRATAARVLKYLATAASRIFVVQIQDLFALTGIGSELAAHEERVNVPGTYNDFNWTYRIPTTLAELGTDSELIDAIRQITAARAQ